MFPCPGHAKSAIETPALIIDLDALDRNISTMADYFSQVPAYLRPHSKTHKSPAIAHKQIDAGAIGVCCQKLGEAEVMLKAGVKDILITNEIVDSVKIERLVGLARHGDVKVAVDDLNVAKRLAKTAGSRGVEQGVVIEVDVGLGRCGVQPGHPTLTLAKALSSLDGIELRGLMGYEGPFINLADLTKRKQAAHKRIGLLVDTAELLRSNGVDVEIVSAGATGTHSITGEYPGITEVEAGSYVFMDTTYKQLPDLDFDCALTVLATVISTPVEGRAVVDAGMKTITRELGLPQVKALEGVRLVGLSEEHGTLRLAQGGNLRIGDKIELIPSHCCTTVNLHEHYVGVRADTVEVVWGIPARGKVW
jgi:D-serine deaminase-like pyridoxal phosphate-dependent protein